ncbi:MAG: (E)-4-hydroxy-3-methylbut-2-enyl-diphosphate synthase [Bacteroidales bacterium]|nr:(E)-4-hydroxy-3-methylbut-2-enyl-diphosphate synthase [Bacteroidales bacterium]
METNYCKSFITYSRRQTNEVYIGDIPLGGNNPVRLQSMTNTDTQDTQRSVEQIIRIYNNKADYVRLTAPTMRDVENLKDIITELSKRNCPIPVIADVHFNARLAKEAASIVHKVRINPGNFIDKKSNGSGNFSEIQYRKELSKLEDVFTELISICKKHKTALRIGTNHGSLSGRIMNRYGDTPEGMAESAMELLRICKRKDFDQVVVSMKASNTRVMVYSTRLLVKKMEEEGMQFPLHLGVTEAGGGEDGRIKSAIGIGAMLIDGIGDTIRVSLTEDPELEIPVAKKIVDYMNQRVNHDTITAFEKYPLNPYQYKRRITDSVKFIGGNQLAVVIKEIENNNDLQKIGWQFIDGKWKFSELSPDIIFTNSWPDSLPVPNEKSVIMSFRMNDNKVKNIIPLYARQDYYENTPSASDVKFVLLNTSELDEEMISLIKNDKNAVIVLESGNANATADTRAAIIRMINSQCKNPVIVKRNYSEKYKEDFQIKASVDTGTLLIDGLIDGIWLENKNEMSADEIVNTSFALLQAGRMRFSKTEYISCPSCGRTLFDLQTTTQKIRAKTSHLKGLKIGVMGCIVNGPGEMADADYGYVGTGKGKITLYKEKNVIQRNVPEDEAVEKLIEIIKENGDWIEP